MLNSSHRLKWKGNLAIFSHTLVMFASTLNGIAATVRCVSFMIVVLNAKLPRLVAAHANKKDGEKRMLSKSAVAC